MAESPIHDAVMPPSLFLADRSPKHNSSDDIQCDPSKRFGREVPKRARQLPLLAYSILTFSSRHQVMITGIDDESSEEYHSHALRILIPILDDPMSSLDENLLAAAVLLRLYEEMCDVDTGTHLVGCAQLWNNIPDFIAESGLSEAASWILLRQNLHISLIKGEPMQVDLNKYRRSISFIDTTDEDFANRIILLCCQVLETCFGPGAQPDYETWAHLGKEVALWHDSIPAHYHPYHSGRENTSAGFKSAFPVVWMMNPAQVMGYQHYCLARILLHISEPRQWVSSLRTIEHRVAADKAALNDLHIAVGLGIHNPSVVGAGFTVHHMLFACIGAGLADLELLEHWHRYPVTGDMTETTRQLQHDLVRLGFSHHYLLNSILGLTALQLYSEDRSQSKWYVRAVAHQQTAITRARPHFESLTQAHEQALLGFSAFMSMYAVAEPIYRPNGICSESPFDPVEELLKALRFSRSTIMFVQQSFPPVVVSGSWLLTKFVAHHQGTGNDLETRYPQLEFLQRCINSQVEGVRKKACLDAVKALFRRIATLSDNIGDPEPAKIVWGWGLEVSQIFLDLCSARHPAALVILGHFAVLMNYNREHWCLSPWPAGLLSYIIGFLGNEWEYIMKWPASIVFGGNLAIDSLATKDFGVL
ncbi:ARCA-like protein [Fusarium subglutinans]|uniref:ARCA-like protein n=1 Tax=Gibberella subglutinans TaxID=42677 RepID=A0A8H5PB70_GIBSU|nr:ARCA-like protein [Fusarium subglutinans]KAF5593399.1 ARCA-like protein [Fusarium subglutinans]